MKNNLGKYSRTLTKPTG